MNDMIIQLVTAFFGSLFFCATFHVENKNILPAALGGMLSWAVLLLVQHTLTPDTFLINFAASAAGVLYAEVMARFCQAPTTVFIVISIIPTVPGGGLFYTMSAFVQKDAALFAEKGMGAMMAALGIAAGIVFTSVLFRAIPEKVRGKLYLTFQKKTR